MMSPSKPILPPQQVGEEPLGERCRLFPPRSQRKREVSAHHRGNLFFREHAVGNQFAVPHRFLIDIDARQDAVRVEFRVSVSGEMLGGGDDARPFKPFSEGRS